MSDILHSDNLFGSEALDNETELIPLITAEDEEQMNAETTPPELPILPLRNTVLFPGYAGAEQRHGRKSRARSPSSARDPRAAPGRNETADQARQHRAVTLQSHRPLHKAS